MKTGAPASFGAQLKALREAAGFTQDELATIAGLSVHSVSALERGERRRPHVDTVRALSAALDLSGATRDALLGSARAPVHHAAVDELSTTSLPLALTALLGREADLQTLREWLADPAVRLITLVGPGGVGKTRLALELARVVAEAGDTRVVFVPLAVVCDPGFVALAIAQALGLSDVTPVELPIRVRAACDNHPTLLVLDNCEHLLHAAPLAAELLSSAAALRLLATSRAPLRVRGEREYAVRPLALDSDAEAMAPADLARSPAVRLFLERVRDVQPGFRLTSANGPTVTRICRRLDALPLALELAAPWMKVLTVEDLLHRLDHDVLLSNVRSRDLPGRQQTMNTTVAWSYQLLDQDAQRVFRRLGALPGRFPMEAAAAVLGGRESSSPSSEQVLAAAAGLIDKSLLLRANSSLPTRPLYQMLETIRAYAGLELVAAGERDDALDGLARHYRDEAALAAEGLIGQAQAEWLERVHEDLENYRAALTWLMDGRHHAEACDIAWGLLFFWLIRGQQAEALRWFEHILSGSAIPPAVEARALVGASVMSFTRGDLTRTRTALTRALSIDAATTDVAVMGENLLGHVEHAEGNFEAARGRFISSHKGFQALSTSWGTGNALMGLASVDLAAGDIERAERLLDEATSVLQETGPWFLNLPRFIRAILAVQRGNADEAIAFARASLGCSRQLHDRFAFVYALTPLAAAAVLKGDHAWAARILGARDALTERAGATSVGKSVVDLRERTEREVRARLGPDRWERAHAAGRSASIDSLLKDIDRGGS